MIEVRRTRDEAEFEAAMALRAEIFIREQGVSHEGEVDGLDPQATHLVAIDEDGHVIGTCRILTEGTDARFGRLCVTREGRGRGVGAALLAEAEREARAAGATRMVLHAQTDALTLYERGGYTPVGERFMEEGLEHLGMEKAL